MSRDRRRSWQILLIASPLLAGCVSSGAYEAALADAQTARIAAARSEAELRALQATVASLERRLDAQSPPEVEVRAVLDLVRSLRALHLVEARPSSGAVTRPLDGADPWGPGRTAAAQRVGAPPLDAGDPW